MSSVYFETSVFISLLKGEERCKDVKDLLRNLKDSDVRIFTSILTIQEISVAAYIAGGKPIDSYEKVSRLARVQNLTKEMVLLAAKYEAAIITNRAGAPVEKARRKWDCFHVATATVIGCSPIYTFDKGMIRNAALFGVSVPIIEPRPKIKPLPFEDETSPLSPDPL